MKRLFQLILKKIIILIEGIAKIPYRKAALDVCKFIGDIMHRALFNVLLPKKYRTLTRQEIYTIIFRSDTPRGKKFDVWLLILICLNIVVITLESVSETPEFENLTSITQVVTGTETVPQDDTTLQTEIATNGSQQTSPQVAADADIVDNNTHETNWFVIVMRLIGWLFTILFTFEFYLRIYCLDNPKSYLTSFFGIIDMLSIFPAYLSLFFPAASTLSVLRLMRVLRIFRIYKMQKFLDESKFMINALKRSAVKIFVFMIFVLIIAVILGATMYGIEGDKNPAISSIPRGVYWAVVTITTVGYGDITPVTSIGQFIAMAVMLLGYSIIAVPTGIVAGETIEEHKRDRHKKKKGNHELNQPKEPENHDIPVAPTSADPGVKASPEDLL